MGMSRALGALLCIATILVAVLHIYFGYLTGAAIGMGLSFALPVTVGVLAVCGLGFWLGWIMVTTKEVSPPAPSSEPVKEETPPEE